MTGRLRQWWAGWTLRARLLAAVIALLALICLIVGVVTDVVLRGYLIQQVDTRLQASSGHFGQPEGGGPGGQLGSSGQQGPPPGTITAHITGGVVDRASYTDAQFVQQTPTAAQVAALAAVPVDNQPHTSNLPGLGDYRIAAVRTPDGDVVVTGLSLGDVDDTLVRLAIIEACVALAGMIGVGLVGESIIRRTLRPLRRVAATASRVSEMELDRGEVALSVRVPDQDTDVRTEVGQVGASLNRMLRHVSAALTARQESEVRVRQFVADASHELRTPLAAIRGYAELTRRVRDGVPEDVAYAMRRVESESARMTTLVDDLLLLARIDSGRPLEHEPVDLSRLVVDAVSDAHVASPDHLWRLDLPDQPVSVIGDGPRLHQVLANLLANARTHTPPGTTVIVTLVETGEGGATLRVVDNGPGIPPALLPDVFDRFARGDTSRSRAAGSTGLGLAIVAAVIDAHGGTVEACSKPGETAFTVTLPAAPSAGPLPDPETHPISPETHPVSQETHSPAL